LKSHSFARIGDILRKKVFNRRLILDQTEFSCKFDRISGGLFQKVAINFLFSSNDSFYETMIIIPNDVISNFIFRNYDVDDKCLRKQFTKYNIDNNNSNHSTV
jgi:hypothetical protein